jgi:hypothetical protein
MCDITEEPVSTAASARCKYQHGTIECRGDGYLWDADSDGYDPEDFSWPCPECNTAQFLQERKEHAECVSEGESMTWRYTGESLWLDAVNHAREINPEAAEMALADIGFVDALRPSRTPEGFETVRYVYPPLSGSARA